MKKHLLYVLLLTVYGALLFKVMVLKDVPMLRIGHLMLNFGGTREDSANLMPFKTILPYLMGEKGWIIAGINLVGNIIFLIPVGFLLPLAFPKINWKIMLLLAVAAGFLIEGMQVVLRVGIFDIDDVLLNALGVILGYGVYLLLSGATRSMSAKRKTTVAFLVFAAAVALWGITISPIGILPVTFEAAPMHHLPDQLIRKEGVSNSCCDPCGGTGGTGQIMAIADHVITLKRKDGVIQYIKLVKQTIFKNPSGTASESDLKVGDRVTVIIGLIKEDDMMASAVLVCDVSRSEASP